MLITSNQIDEPSLRSFRNHFKRQDAKDAKAGTFDIPDFGVLASWRFILTERHWVSGRVTSNAA